MKKNWALIFGILYLVFTFGYVALKWGQVQEAYIVDWQLILGGVGASVVPFVLGWLAGRYRG